MMIFSRLQNPFRNYSWGDSQTIPQFLAQESVTGVPVAEMWMGTHRLAPSMIKDNYGTKISLRDLIKLQPLATLGSKITDKNNDLPFLFKLLSAAKALSIQVHPDLEKAQEGFHREQVRGISLDAPNRNYPDNNHKPEIIVALSPFYALSGFRQTTEIHRLLSVVDFQGALDPVLPALKSGNDFALKKLMTHLLGMEINYRSIVVEKVLNYAASSGSGNPDWSPEVCKWINELSRQYPGDIGILGPLFLNIVELKPFQALFQEAGVIHAYLKGFGVELMASSDNVLRCGLTSKHIDIPELIKIVQFKSFKPVVRMAKQPDQNGFGYYDIPTSEFSLALVKGNKRKSACLRSGQGPCIILGIEDSLLLKTESEQITLKRGESVFIANNSPKIIIVGEGTCMVAGVDDLD